MKKNYIFFFLLLLSPVISWATHIRAGEITATRVAGTQLTYRVTLVTYADEVGGKAANDGQEWVEFNFGFSTNRVERMRVYRKGNRTLISRATSRNVYDTTYTFPAAGYYTIGCSIVNRNANTLNLQDPRGSENISFYVQTSILINANIGFNSTPILLNIPIDSAAVGQRYIHNPGAFDVDGDSLSYKLTIPRKDQVDATGSTTGRGVFIPEYVDPNTIGPSPVLNQAGTGPATFSINPRTGDLVWDVPRQAGQYNVAFVIEEWRKGFDGGYIKIGEIVRDMQIIVVETENIAPVLTVPEDICVEAGEKVEFEVIGQDQNITQLLRLTSSGGLYNVDPAGKPLQNIPLEAAKFTSTPTVAKVVGKFEWTTNCLHAREQAYNVVFKVEDSPGRFNTTLVDIKSLNIRVLPPRPKALVAEERDAGNVLTWAALTACNENGKILVYRKNGCSGLNPGACTSGMPASWGYQLIGEVTTKDTTFTDTNAEKGEIYSYRLVTEIAENTFINIRSAPSVEFCIGSDIKPGSPVITKVSVTETSLTTGKIEVKWTQPVGVNLSSFIGEKLYKVYRAEGLGGENYTLVHTKATTFADSSDTVFIDQNLDTEEKVYRYKVEFYTETSKLNGTALPASSVRLQSRTSDKAVPLNWETNTPWTNENNIHYVYREDPNDPTKFNLIHKVQVTGANSFTYTDTGVDSEHADGDISMELVNGDKYCYKVLTHGQYQELQILGTLSNYSQVRCATPLDQSPPCTPTITVTGGINCEQLSSEDLCQDNMFVNTLTWNNPLDQNGNLCRDDIVSYSIYYSRYEVGDPILLASLPATEGVNTFRHSKNRKEGFAGCYYIKSRNSLGLESGLSERICFDNCETLSFPNAFSPNNDGKNDTFTPMRCQAFINEATIEIYSAHGVKVRSIVSETIEWDGKDDSGKLLGPGTYYYVINVNFERLNVAGSNREYKGYVTLIK